MHLGNATKNKSEGISIHLYIHTSDLHRSEKASPAVSCDDSLENIFPATVMVPSVPHSIMAPIWLLELESTLSVSPGPRAVQYLAGTEVQACLTDGCLNWY